MKIQGKWWQIATFSSVAIVRQKLFNYPHVTFMWAQYQSFSALLSWEKSYCLSQWRDRTKGGGKMDQLVAPTGVLQHTEYQGVRHTNPWKPQACPYPSMHHGDAVGEQAALLASIWDSQAITKATFCKSTNPLYCGEDLHLQHTAESSVLSPADGKGRNLLSYLKRSFHSLQGSLHLALACAPGEFCPPTDPSWSSSMQQTRAFYTQQYSLWVPGSSGSASAGGTLHKACLLAVTQSTAFAKS